MKSALVVALAALVVAVVAVGGWLIGQQTRPLSSGVAQTAAAGDLHVTVRLDQAALGERVVDVQVQDSQGRPVELRGVRLRFTMREMDMGTVIADAEPIGRGRYQARGAFFSMVGQWEVHALLQSDGLPERELTFAFPIAAPGEQSGPLNPLAADAGAIVAGERLYAANCVACHGPTGRGDGPRAAGLNPRPADLALHMAAGKHTDGQIFLWISDGMPGTAMPGWGEWLSDEQIWQLVTYLRTFGAAPPSAAEPGPVEPDAPPGMTPAPDVDEALPPLVFVRDGNLWRSDGSAAPPRQLTDLGGQAFAQYPATSPDGRQVAFVGLISPPVTATVPLPTTALFLVNVDGSELTRLWAPEQGTLSLPAWAPDGRSLWLAGSGLPGAPENNAGQALQVLRFDLASGAGQALLNNALDPAVSPDGSLLAFLRLDDDSYAMALRVAAPDGSDQREVIDSPVFSGLYAPRFSPDGRQLVFAASGGPQTDEAGYPLGATGERLSLAERLLGWLEPPPAAAHGAPWDVWIVNVDGSGLRRLTWLLEDMPISVFAPDGSQLAIMGTSGIYLVDVDGQNLRRISPLGDHSGLDWGS